MKRSTSILLTLGALLTMGVAGAVVWRQRVAWPLPAETVAHPVWSVKVADNPQAFILAPHVGAEAIDEQIVAAQQALRGASPQRAISATEHLGRLFVTKARLSHDAGFYKLAEQCAASLERAGAGTAEALLLRGHVLDALHRFADAEKIGRHLITIRENVLDHALLGDALLEQGRVDEAVPVYQAMIDLKPCLITYSRISHLRWVKGDLDGALEMMEQAVATGTARDPEPLAWTTTRLASLQWQADQRTAVHRTIARALEVIPQYAPALLLQGKVFLGEGRAAEAVEILREAVRRNPLPEYQWVLADALNATEKFEEAAAVEKALKRTGASEDPRTYSLYLSTRGADASEALKLAEGELAQRQDIFTYDALAWAQRASAQLESAWTSVRIALVEETKDARLFLHAGVIASELGKKSEATEYLNQAERMRAQLLPSERVLLAGGLAGARAGAGRLGTEKLTEN